MKAIRIATALVPLLLLTALAGPAQAQRGFTLGPESVKRVQVSATEALRRGPSVRQINTIRNPRVRQAMLRVRRNLTVVSQAERRRNEEVEGAFVDLGRLMSFMERTSEAQASEDDADPCTEECREGIFTCMEDFAAFAEGAASAVASPGSSDGDQAETGSISLDENPFDVENVTESGEGGDSSSAENAGKAMAELPEWLQDAIIATCSLEYLVCLFVACGSLFIPG